MTHAPSPALTPRRGRPGYDRETLLRVCVEVFNLHGYDATSMGTLSERLGISKSAIYHHVESKEAILDQALNRALDALEDVISDEGGTAVSELDRLEHVMRRTVAVLIDHMPYVTLLLRLRGNSEVELRALERRRTITGQVAALIERAQQEGSIRTDLSSRSAARLLLGMINSVVDLYKPGTGESTDDLADTILTLALSGLRTQ